jgi:hypothetical protein
MASLCGESSGALGRDLVTGKQYSCVSASTTWTMGKSRVKSLLLLTVYFGTPSMFITLWFGFDYGTNPPLGTLII